MGEENDMRALLTTKPYGSRTWREILVVVLERGRS